jgi:hypothetical protein
MTRELIECYYDTNEQAILEYVRSRCIIRDAELHLEAEMEGLKEYVDKLGQDFWYRLDRITSAQNSVEAEIAKEMYIRGFLDFERMVCRNEEDI